MNIHFEEMKSTWEGERQVWCLAEVGIWVDGISMCIIHIISKEFVAKWKRPGLTL